MMTPLDISTDCRSTPRSRQVAYFVLVAAVVAIGLTFTRGRPGDLGVYNKAAGRMARGEEIYRPKEGKAFTYPPFFAVPFIPLAILPEQLSRGVFYFLNICLLGVVVSMVLRQAWPVIPPHNTRKPLGETARGVPWSPVWVFLLCVFILAGRYAISPIEYQGHDMIVFLLVMLVVVNWDARNRWSAGAWVGLAAACKATPLLFLPVLVWQRRFTAIVGLFVAIIAASLLPDLIFPREDGGLWVTSWYRNFVAKVDVGSAADAEGAWVPWNILNQSLAGTLYRLSTPVPVADESNIYFDVSLWRLDGPVLKVLTTVCQLTIVGILAIATWPTRSRGLPEAERIFLRLGQGAAVMCGMLLLSPMSSKQHFCTLLVPITFCVTDYLYRRRDRLVGFAMLVLFAIGTLGAKDLIGRSIGNWLLASGSLTLSTLVCLLATTYVIVGRSHLAREEFSSGATAG